MSSGFTHGIRIDDRLESYTTFFDHAWARTIDDLGRGTKLETPVFNLCISWKAAANTCVLPWLMCTSVSDFSIGFSRGDGLTAFKLIDACAKRLPAEMPGLSNMRRKEMREAIAKLGKELRDTQAEFAAGVDAKQMWMAFLTGPGSQEFGLGIWGSQRLAYGAIYHAYENFIREAVGLALGDPDYRALKVSVLIADCQRTFGKPIADLCLSDPDVDIARLVRNALAHNGGKETSQLQAVNHGIMVDSGQLQVMAPHTRQLFDLLKGRAFKLAEKAVTHPSIR
jgi:hypothetical protein